MSITTEGASAMPMKNPPHRGSVVLRQCIEPLGLTITAAAAALGVTRTTLSELVHGKHGIPGNGCAPLQSFRGSARELAHSKIGRASCRERVWHTAVAVSL